MLNILIWYFAILLVGIIAIPIGLYLFKDLHDFAYPIYKGLGLAIIAYLVWMLGMARLVPFGVASITIAFFSMAVMSFRCFKKTKSLYNTTFLKTALLYEMVFFLIFGTLIIYKLFRSDISDIEKFMDFAFLNTILKQEYFPPIDPWFSGHTMNYYYFGHLVAAVLAKATNIKPAIAYNLMQATNYALFIMGIGCVSYNLTKKYFWTAITIVIAAGMSNTNYLILHAKKLDSYWWAGTRIIPGTINEFPLYSFLLGDLHAHYLDLPFVMVTLVSLFTFFIKEDDSLGLKIFIGFILGLLFVTNSWDYLIYSGIFAAITIYRNAFKNRDYFKIIVDGAVTGITSIVVLLPFYLTFHPALGGFNLVTAPKSLLKDFLILFVFQVFVLGFYLAYKFVEAKNDYKIIAIAVSVLGGFVLFPFSQVSSLVVVFLPLWLVAAVSDTRNKESKKSEQFINIIMLAAFLIVIFCEYFYFKDIYGIEFQRANTVFKFHYQLWILFAVATGYAGSFFSDISKTTKWIFYLTAGVLFFLSVANLPSMIRSSANQFKAANGLDGSKYLQAKHPADSQAIEWINDNIKDSKVIAEASGDSYTYDSRISVFTGSLAPLGWFGHEWGWRNIPDELNVVKDDMQTLFTTNNKDTVSRLVSKYNIDFIYFGEIEAQRYTTSNWAVESVCQKVYDRNNVRIFKTTR